MPRLHPSNAVHAELVLVPMQTAKYFCTGDFEEHEKWQHYALAVPYYTHFTSPIRRYPDVLVHRLLAAALHLNPAIAQQAAEEARQAAESRAAELTAAAESQQAGESQQADESQQRAEAQQADESQQRAEAQQDVFESQQGAESQQPHHRLESNTETQSASQRRQAPAIQSNGSGSTRGTLVEGLMEGEELSAVAQHCNERKQAAKNVQVGLSPSYVFTDLPHTSSYLL